MAVMNRCFRSTSVSRTRQDHERAEVQDLVADSRRGTARGGRCVKMKIAIQ